MFLPAHVDSIFSYEKKKLEADLSELQIEMKAWDQPWRKESLDHYSNLGWSFVAVDDNNEILGYTLGQPFLFFNNWTQSLWIEHMSFENEDVGHQLVDTVIRWAKTKHLQKVLVNSDCEAADFAQSTFTGFKDKGYLHLSTTKMEEALR